MVSKKIENSGPVYHCLSCGVMLRVLASKIISLEALEFQIVEGFYFGANTCIEIDRKGKDSCGH